MEDPIRPRARVRAAGKARRARRTDIEERRIARRRERAESEKAAGDKSVAVAALAREALVKVFANAGVNRPTVLSEERVTVETVAKDESVTIVRARVGIEFYGFTDELARVLVQVADETGLGFGVVRPGPTRSYIAYFHAKDDEDSMDEILDEDTF